MNSGGSGPDDYLIRKNPRGKWTRVIFRWGRNGKLATNPKADYESDHAAMEWIFKDMDKVCVPDQYARFRKLEQSGRLVTMNATEFAKSNGWVVSVGDR